VLETYIIYNDTAIHQSFVILIYFFISKRLYESNHAAVTLTFTNYCGDLDMYILQTFQHKSQH